MKKLLTVLSLALCLTASAQVAAPPATPLPPGIKVEAEPALWQIKGVHGTVYLFGSVHVMRKEVHWETPKVKDAFKSSSVLYLEISDIDEDSVKAMQPLIMQLGLDIEHPLSTKIPREDVDTLDAAIKKMGAPGESAMEPMQPWMAYLTLSVLPAMQAGYDPGSGIDQVLAKEAKTDGKTIKGFETAEQQIHYLADFPVDQQVMMLHQALTDLPKSETEMNETVADWTHGDVDKIATLDNDEMTTKYPVLYDKLVLKRNIQFTDVIAGLLKDPATGTIFVTVGAGHLAGSDSVVKMLTNKGFTVTRIE
jgi:uncharacterized protein